jgi:hypothetical protein
LFLASKRADDADDDDDDDDDDDEEDEEDEEDDADDADDDSAVSPPQLELEVEVLTNIFSHGRLIR